LKGNYANHRSCHSPKGKRSAGSCPKAAKQSKIQVSVKRFLAKATDKPEEEGVQEIENLMRELISIERKYGPDNFEKTAMAELERITGVEYEDNHPEEQRKLFDEMLRKGSEKAKEDLQQMPPQYKKQFLNSREKQVKHYVALLKKWGYSPEYSILEQAFCNIWFEYENHKYSIKVSTITVVNKEYGKFSLELPFFYKPKWNDKVAERIKELHAMNNMASWTNSAMFSPKVYVNDDASVTAAIHCMDPYPIKKQEQLILYLEAIQETALTFKGLMAKWERLGRKLFNDGAEEGQQA
jgi:hypothetical protein